MDVDGNRRRDEARYAVMAGGGSLAETAIDFMDDLRSRRAIVSSSSSDGHRAHLEAVPFPDR